MAMSSSGRYSLIRMSRNIEDIIIFFFLISGFLAGVADCAEKPWTFVVMGDTRDKVVNTATGISPDLPKLAAAIAAENPDFVLHTGDLTNGYYTSPSSPVHGKYREMFRNWKAAVRPIYDYTTGKGSFIYLVRGNHEDGKYDTEPELAKAYEDEFAGLMPQNGPAHEKGLTYMVTHKGVRVFALDGYHETKLKVIRGYVNQGWLNGQLEKELALFTFAFTHTPAYRVGDYHESPFPNLYSHPEKRDELWNSLKRSGTVAYFCGHIHFYCRGTINGIEQLVVGNGGADTVSYNPGLVDPLVKLHYPASAVAAAQIETGYLLMTVDEQAGTVTGLQKLWNGRKKQWERGDTFILKNQRQSGF